MAYPLLIINCIGCPEIKSQNRAEEAIMNLMHIDTSKCERAEKEVIEGICLSYDMLKGVCLETMKECDAVQKDDE
jgi:hypothetical protein